MTSSFNTERYKVQHKTDNGSINVYIIYRCESFNGVMRSYNVHSNRQASSRDIAVRFAHLEHLRFVLESGSLG